MTTRLYEWNGEGAMLTIGELRTPPVATVTFLPSNEDSSVVLLVFALEGKIVVDGGGADGDGVTCMVYEMRNSQDNKNTIVKPLAWLKNMGEIASIYPYRFAGTNYLLIVGDESTSAIYFWDGNEFKKWLDVPDLRSTSILNILQRINGDTLLFVCNENTLLVYEIEHRSCTLLSIHTFSPDQRVVDVTVWEHRGIPMIMLIKQDPITGVYNTELWSLHFRQKIPDVTHEDVQQCLYELQVALDKRGAALEESERFMNQIMSGMPLKFDQIFIDSDRVELSSLEFDVEDSESLNPEIILDELLELRAKVDDLLRKASMANEIEDLSGRGLVVEGDAYINELEIDRLEVETINGVAFDAASILLDELDQTFDGPLEAKNIVIHDLEVPSICGLESSNWLLVGDEEKTDLSGIDWNKASIVGEDTLVVDGDVFVENLSTETINGKNINKLMDDFFIIGKNQIIDGNVTYKTCSRVTQMFADEINGVPFDALLTKSDDQFLDDVYIENLDVRHLYVETINGVRVDQAARISQENVIKGRVSLANLEIIEELEVQGNFSMPFARPLQVYDEVHINGDVYVNNFFMKEQSSLIVDGSDVNVQEILENSWTKSTDQTIVNSVVFEEGASIDELSCRFLNGFAEEDFVYTTDTEFDGLENVTFSHFRFNRVFDENNREISDFIDESPMLLTFKKPIRLKHLQVDSMITDFYNGVDIDQLMSMKNISSLKFPDFTEFEELHVDGSLNVEGLWMETLNSQDASIIKKALTINNKIYEDKLEVPEFSAENLTVENLCGSNLNELLEIMNNPYEVAFTVKGDVEIDNNLQARLINGMNASDYLTQLKSMDPSDLIGPKSLRHLRSVENLNVSTLNGYDVNQVFHTMLDKIEDENYTGDLKVKNVKVVNLKCNKMNGMNLSNLMYVNEPAVFNGNVTFNDLVLKGNLKTKKPLSEAIKINQVLSIKHPINLHVFGDLMWEEDSSKPQSLSYLFKNAMTKSGNQTFDCPVEFLAPVSVDSLRIPVESPALEMVQGVIEDAVIDSDDDTAAPIVIRGRKKFKKELLVNDLTVDGDLNVDRINDVYVDRVFPQIFQKNTGDVMPAVEFSEDIKIGQLISNSRIHNVSLENIATIDKELPNRIRFEHLVVENNVSLKYWDGVNFDEFVRDRITIDGDYQISGDVEFTETVDVIDRTYAKLINGIEPESLVQNDDSKDMKIIYGNKHFMSNLTINGGLEVPKINDVIIDDIYALDSVKSAQNIEICGDLIFENDVEFVKNINVAGHTYGSILNYDTDIDRLFTEDPEFYLEESETINKIHVANAFKFKSSRISESITRLDIYTIEPGNYCGLTDSNCQCRRQHVVDILPSGEYSLRSSHDNDVVFNFYDAKDRFELSVASSAVSTGQDCLRGLDLTELTRVFLTMFYEDPRDRKLVAEIQGFVTDADIFVLDDKIYLFVAVFYDKTWNSHSTASWLYEFDFARNTSFLIQAIPTEGAASVKIFEIVNVGVHLLVGCIKGNAESSLWRFVPNFKQFQLVRTFATGGSEHVASLSYRDSNFVLLSNPDVEAVQIFNYDFNSDSFDNYQNLFFDSKVMSLDVFYAREFAKSAAYVLTTTKDGSFFIHVYNLYAKFQLLISYRSEDIQILSPFRHSGRNYLFAGSKVNSTIYDIVQ
ncbi:hypothetical protein TKK_0005357 [Trichogramma kaykai]